MDARRLFKWLVIISLLLSLLLIHLDLGLTQGCFDCGQGAPAAPAAPVAPLQGATYITDEDNENNDHTGTPDGDMSESDDCVYRTEPHAPIEFNINVTGTLPTTDATLTLYVWDVDEEGEPPEWDEVYFNGHLVGRLTGANETWSTCVFPLDIGWVQAGNNLVEIQINTNPACEPGFWCVGVDWGQLLIDGGATVKADIVSMTTDDCYDIGPSVAVDVVVVMDVVEAGNFRLETNLVDPGNITLDADVYDFSPASASTVTHTVTFTLDNTSTLGTYTVNASLFDRDTSLQQDVEVITFEYAERCGPEPTLIYLYDHTGAQDLGVVEDWEAGLTWANDSQAQVTTDPKGVFGQVAKVYVRGYGHGTETSWISASETSIHGPITVPSDADVIAIPLATADNGDVNETDSEAGIEIQVHHPASGQTVMTYASHIFETRLGVDYIVAFADVSEFQGETIELTITLRQPDRCAGTACTTNEDLYIGDLWFESLPDICTTEADNSHILYDYYDDPTPHPGVSCADPQPYYFIDVEKGPYNAYGVGEDTHVVTATLPVGAEPLQFKVYYGYRSHGFTFNAHTLTTTQVYAAFPIHEGSYVNIAEPSRWMPINDNPEVVAPHLVGGVNTFSFNVFTANYWEERPFDLWARFRVGRVAGLRVNVMPEYYTFVGTENIIWGNCHWDPADTVDTGSYHWDFGDGDSADGTVSNTTGWDHARYIDETHTYTQPGVYTATLTVTADFDGSSDSDEVRVNVYDEAALSPGELEEVKVNKAIEDGLRWLYNRQISDGKWPHDMGYDSDYIAGAGEAVLAFENQGHLPSNDINEDIYAEYIQMGLDYLFGKLSVQEVITQTYIDNPDTNGNGIGLRFSGGRDPYFTPMGMMAIIGSLTPDAVASTGDATYVAGRTYRDIMRDLCDYLAWAQNEAGGGVYRGGWRYSPNDSSSDNSVSQWPALGLFEAEKRWGITAAVYEKVKDELELWLSKTQVASGGFDYWPGRNWINIAKTGAGIIMLNYIGADTSDSRVIKATEYLSNTWEENNYDPGWRYKPYGSGSFYAMYAVYKGCKDAKPSEIKHLPLPAGTLDWYADFVDYLLHTQNADGSWPSGRHGDDDLDTMWAILILSPAVLGGPVADAGLDQEVCVNEAVTLDGSGSYHTIGLNLTEYLWDFNAGDGVDWGSPDASGTIVTHTAGYPVPGDYMVTLRVKDERGNTDTDTAWVHVDSCVERPMLYIEPASATTSVSDTVTVDIRIRDVTNLYGVQLYLGFDPSLVEVVDAAPGGDVNIEPGDFLQPGAVIYTNFVDNELGQIEYVQTREGAVPGVDGSGVLASITFHGKAVGTSPVTFTTHILADPMSVPIAHDHADGEIIVLGMGSVSGRVILERRVNAPHANAGATVELAGQSQVTGNDGYYSFSNVPAGTRRISVTHPSYLPTWRSVDVTAGAPITLPDVTLLGGDCSTPQGTIDGVDSVVMGLAWDSHPGDAHWNSRADVRDDEVINVLDLTAVKYNWGSVSPGPWPATASAATGTWQPGGTPLLGVELAAQASVVISPTTITTSVGMAAVVEVWVQDVENLYGGGFQLMFDPSRVMVQDTNPYEEGVQIESGSWLKRQLEVMNSADNGSGRIDFFVTQSHPATPKSGSGILARITFTGVGEGSSAIYFNSVQLVDDTATEIPATPQDGTVVVQAGYRVYLPVVLRSTST